jgi:tetratricopeptide (TPR) repeat protein
MRLELLRGSTHERQHIRRVLHWTAWYATTLGAGLIAGPLCVKAEESVDAPEYRALVAEALAEFDAGHFAEARALFLHAHSVNPSARTLRGVGLSSFELREYRATIEYLEQALGSLENPLQDELRASTEAVLRRAYGFVGRYTVELQPPGARLRVDGMPSVSAPVLLLEIGSHVITVEAQGHVSETRTLHVLGGEREPLQLSLTPSAAPLPSPAVAALPPVRDTEVPAGAEAARLRVADPAAHDDSARQRPLLRSAWLWTGVAAAVVSASVVGSLIAHQRHGHDVGDTTLTRNTPSGAVIHAWQRFP